MLSLIGIEDLVAIQDELVSYQEEASGATGWVANGVAGLGLHHINDCPNEWAWCEVLAGFAAAVGDALSQQAFVGVALDIRVHC